MWSDALPSWYAEKGRHHLPWRQTRDPWAVLVSEVMLQQTSVARVLPRWRRFLARWPVAQSCAASPLEDVLREWDGLGYPRRARALHATAREVAARGWPPDEAGLRDLPGIGEYTARALLLFAFDDEGAALPRDVNLGRVAARAALGQETHQATASQLDTALVDARPGSMTKRDYAYALFDIGATVCLARRPRCSECPAASWCASRERLRGVHPESPPRRQSAYAGSLRQLRGAVLRAMLGDDPPADVEALRRRVSDVPAAARPDALGSALAGLRRDGLIGGDQPATQSPSIG
ncbi:MAG TPA: A/G-specific adenine glycosylase [Candidatus Dormibacteraeota bacterium]|nr:A/G-specific adenine glycosylase [Candidatus Dormibacteraeota bacterium]